MKRILIAVLICLCTGLVSRAQFIINDNVMNGRMSEVTATVVDSLSNEPIAFASVYIIPSKDTVITNLTLSDAKGEAKLEEIPYGSYTFHVEMMGYKPFVVERYFRNSTEDLGTIRLQEDELFLEAATVTAVGNPIVIKKDTVEFNASSFSVGANAMLKDLLQRMPGIEITENGTVKFNGEAIDKLTVGGRTFFFGDQSTALNNLPASVVDKIRVIDRESEEARASGIQDGDREKVLDVGLKQEYEEGWFGNAGFRGGTTLSGDKADEPLRDNRGFIYSGNSLVSAYTKKDQLTVIANAQNVDDSNVTIAYMGDDGEVQLLNQGISAAAQLGLNANTSRIKDVESTVSVNYKYSDTDSGTQSDRTTYQEDGNLASSSTDAGKQYWDTVTANMEFQKETGKVWFHIRPSFRFSKDVTHTANTSETLREGTFVNSSENNTSGSSKSTSTGFSADATLREIGGKDGRTLRLGFESGLDWNSGFSDETSILKMVSGQDIRTMHYDSNGNNSQLSGSLRWAEPFGEKWKTNVNLSISSSKRNDVRDAFDAAGKNDFYSSVSKTNYMTQEYGVGAQYSFGEGSYVSFSGKMNGNLNETFSKSYGIETTTGKDEWTWFFLPSFEIEHSKGNDRYMFYFSSFNMRPSPSRMLPVLNIGNPSRLSMGNIYLKPYTQTYVQAQWSRNNREKFSTLMMYFTGQITSSPIRSAQWYDASGVMYSIPLNARMPSISSSLTLNYTTPLNEAKVWTLTLSAYVDYSSSASYQARTILPALDKDSFDYAAFMADFWGDETGDRFYGGKSGFNESRTRSMSPYAGLYIRYNKDGFSGEIGSTLQGRISRYSLDPKANMNTLDTKFSARGSYVTKNQFEFNSYISYNLYKGYPAGYNLPELQWNGEISKNIGAFNLSVKVNDILNQTHNRNYTVTDNYEQSTYRLIMGRYVLFGVKWNFGKMNAAHSQRAQQAAWNMVF